MIFNGRFGLGFERCIKERASAFWVEMESWTKNQRMNVFILMSLQTFCQCLFLFLYTVYLVTLKHAAVKTFLMGQLGAQAPKLSSVSLAHFRSFPQSSSLFF